MKSPEIEALLPGVFQEALREHDDPLRALLEVMEQMHAPVERVLNQLHIHFDPLRCPQSFVPFLAAWVGLRELCDDRPRHGLPGNAFPVEEGIGRLRELVRTAAQLARWRGTKRGLELYLSTATGCAGFEVEERHDPSEPPFRIRVRAPEAARRHAGLIQRIINMEKPAHVECEPLTFDK